MDKNKIKINQEGRKTLTNLLLSCVLMPTKLSSKQEAVRCIANFDSDLFDIDSIQAKTISPNHLPILDKLQVAARAQGQTIIDSEFLWRFFGGQAHYEDVLNDIQMIPEANRQLWTLSHMLLPVAIDEKHGEFADVIYRNGSLETRFQNVYIPKHIHAEPRDVVLIHYATVVDTRCQLKIVQDLLNCQGEFTEFIAAVKAIDCIDFKKFFTGNLTQRTKDIFVKN